MYRNGHCPWHALHLAVKDITLLIPPKEWIFLLICCCCHVKAHWSLSIKWVIGSWESRGDGMPDKHQGISGKRGIRMPHVCVRRMREQVVSGEHAELSWYLPLWISKTQSPVLCWRKDADFPNLEVCIEHIFYLMLSCDSQFQLTAGRKDVCWINLFILEVLSFNVECLHSWVKTQIAKIQETKSTKFIINCKIVMFCKK